MKVWQRSSLSSLPPFSRDFVCLFRYSELVLIMTASFAINTPLTAWLF